MNDVHNVRDYKSRLIATLERLDDREVNAFIDALAQALSEERAIFIFGNGGSAATASHMTCDLNKGCSYGRDRRFKVICLNDNLPTMMAYANDVSYHDIFVEPLKNFLRPGDLVIGISGSGNSENVLRAIDYANANGALTVGLCGYSGGKLKQKAGIVVHVAVDDMQIAEDVHLVLGHMAMQALAGRSCC